MSDNVSEVLLVGAGAMAREYAKVLTGLGRSFAVVGRGEKSARSFQQETGHAVLRGGIESYLQSAQGKVPSHCIIAVRVEQLAEVCCSLLRHGAKKILLEKPGSFHLKDMRMMAELARANGAEISIAYNRRFYAATRAARKMIAEDGGVVSFQFEFTEWLHNFPSFERTKDCVWSIFFGNSTHVLDMAFFLGGWPQEINCYSRPAVENPECTMAFAGAGRTEQGALFSYHADWEAPGRWWVEILTRKRRYVFRPMEKLQVQQLRSVKLEEVELDYSLDEAYKPGVYLETKAFLEHDENFADLCTLDEQMRNVELYGRFA